MVTACHDVPGSSSAETNEWRNMINATAYMIPPLNEKMVAASQRIEYGSTGTEIRALTNMTPLAIEKMNPVSQERNEAAKGYLPPDELWGLRIAQLLGEWKEISGVSMHPVWGSLACGKNYNLNSHVDEDFFYSLTTVAAERGLQEDIDRYSMDAEVCNYFTFVDQGIAVALRPGDMLIFIPVYHHCLSSYLCLQKWWCLLFVIIP
jgi:hypothetical protein